MSNFAALFASRPTSLLIIGLFYMLTSWLMVMGEGADKLVDSLKGLADPTTFLFVLAERYVGHWIVPVMQALFVTSLFAGVLAFHNGVARYIYVAGREKLLPHGHDRFFHSGLLPSQPAA